MLGGHIHGFTSGGETKLPQQHPPEEDGQTASGQCIGAGRMWRAGRAL